MKKEKSLRNCPRIEETKGTLQLVAVWNLDWILEQIKDIRGKTGEF